MKNNSRVLLITFSSFLIYFFIDELTFPAIRTWFYGWTSIWSLSHILTYLLVGIPLFIGTAVLTSKNDFLNALGVSKSIMEGAGFALLFTLPMFLGYAIVFEFSANLTLDKVLIGAFSAGFFEELYFRAFLFGMIFRYSTLGFIPSVLIGALLFGSVHLYQSQDMGTLIGIFLTTFMGAVLFAWMYTEWKYNLWIPIFLHTFMNLSWMMFAVSDNAFGNLWGNVFRYSTVAFAIIFTVLLKIKKEEKIEINKKTLWIKSTS